MKTFKRLCTFVVLVTTFANMAFGTVAYPYPVNIKQADGTMVTVRIIGDEFVRLYRTLDGYSVMFNDTGHLVYAQQDTRGMLIPTKTLAHNVADRRAEENGVLGVVPKMLTMPKAQLDSIRSNNAMQLRKMVANGYSVEQQNVTPMHASARAVTGKRRTLVILMEFPDKKFTKSRDDFDRLMNETGFSDNGARGSVRDYFAESSLSQLEVISEVAGPYMAEHEMSYYGASSMGYDRNPWGLISEAVHKAESDVDFTQFDNDKDGVVDGVHIIYAGYGEEAGGGSNAIWAHSSSISESVDGVVVRKYSCSPELRGNYGQSMTHIGVICHELGHVFGCMDYYDTDYSTGGQYQGTGMWDIMGAGNWNGDGSTPAHFNPDVKSRVFGWMNVQTLDGSQDKIEIDAESIYRINTGTDNEYYLLENRRQSGFDVGIPGHGLMIYHATTDGNGSILGEATNKINSTHRQNFYPVAAGNSSCYLPGGLAESYGSINSSSCPFPGTSNNNSFSDGTMPAAVSWDGISAEYGIDNIREDGDVVNLDVLIDANDAKGFRCTSVSDKEINLQWTLETGCEYLLTGDVSPIQARPENRAYEVGERIGNTCTVLVAGDYDRFKHENLQNGTDYYYRLYKRVGQGEWSLGKSMKQRTKKIDPSRYPIYEDFSAEVWQQTTSGTQEYKWTLDTLHPDADGGKGLAYWYVRGGMYHESGFALMSSMMQSPVFSLVSAECAAVSFDYTMGDYQELQVYVRREGKSEWEILSTYTGRTDGWESQLIELRDFEGVVQLGFLAVHDVKYGHTLALEQAYIGLDNVGIETNYALKVKTEKPIYVGKSSVEIPITLLRGVQDVEEYGIVISDGNAEEVVLSDEEGSMVLEGLASNTSYTYRGYAKTPAGTFYGREERFKTISLNDGEGTKESPFLINDEDDLVSLSNEVEAGNTFKGCHIVLNDDLCLTNAFPPIGIADYDGTPMKAFEGVFDGNGKSITGLKIKQWNVIDPNCGAYIYGGGLFGCIGRNGVVKNLTVECSGFDVYTVSGGYVGIVVATNHGLVANCNSSVSDTFNSSCNLGSKFSYIRSWGGIAGRNYGSIVSCEFRGQVDLYSPKSGGIASCNCGLIKGCINYGDFYVNGSGKIGGIAGETLLGTIYPFHDDRTYIASIEDCTNFGTIRANGEYFTAGGVAGNGYGTVLRCSNFGNISVNVNNGKSFIAGVAAGEDTYSNKYIIKDCYNGGEVLVEFSAQGSYPAVTVGGIAASSFWYVENCINNANVTLNNSSTFGNQAVAAYIRPVYGNMKSDMCNNCFYVEYGSEHPCETGQKITVSDLDDVVKKLNHGREKAWNIDASLPQPIMEQNPINIGRQYFISADGFTIPIINTDKDYPSLKIEMRDNDGMIVKTEDISHFDTYAVCRMTGLKPATQYTLHATNGNSSVYKEVATGFEGVGTQQIPHIVNKTEQLRALAFLVNNGEQYTYHHFNQECDLDLACDSIHPWVPIGDYGLGFGGVYDGKNHKLTNLYVDDHYPYAGFFGIVGSGGGVGNVSFLGENEVNAPHSVYSGGIVGCQTYAFIELSKCFFHGKVSGGYAVGGLFGYVEAPLYDCGAVVQLSGGVKRGGLAGIANASTDGIEHCYSAATSIDGKPVAGIANPEDGRTLSFPWQSVDSYYQSGDLVTNEIQNHMYPKTEEEMKSQDFVKLLGLQWCADSHENPINEGYPVYKYNSGHEVFTRNYEILEDDMVMLYGTYFGTGEKIKSKGIEYRLSYDSSSPYITIEDTSGLITGMAVSLNVLKDVYYLYRAYVELADSDTRIYGEEKTLYVPQEEVDVIKETLSDGHPEINDIYTISGLRIGSGINASSLKPGIYIVNRKKVVIR